MPYDDLLNAGQPKRRVHLSKEEVEFAKAIGVSLQDFARGKIRMQRELANGDRQRDG
jgi:hypothetical protein